MSIPINIRPEERRYFKDADLKKASPLKVLHLKNVYVTGSGIVLRHFRLLPESVHEYAHLRKDLIKRAYGNLLLKNTQRYNSEETYTIIHNYWCPGYYHWMMEALVRLATLGEDTANAVLLLPDTYPQYAKDSLAAFRIKRIEYFPPSKILKIKHLLFPQNPPRIYEYNRHILLQLKEIFLRFIAEQKITRNIGEKVYISRSNASKRKVRNEAEVVELLTQYGFSTVHLEEENFHEQAAIFSEAKFLVSIHGAGLTNMLYLKENSVVLELYKKPVYETDFASKCFWGMSNALGHQYFIQFCEPVNPQDRMDHADLFVDLARLKENIEAAMPLIEGGK